MVYLIQVKKGYGVFSSRKVFGMKRNFKEKAVSYAAKLTKKCRVLSPLILLGLSIVLGFYYVVKHISSNGKRYTTLACVFLFFFMSSSFTAPSHADEMEVYLSSDAYVDIDENEIYLNAGEDVPQAEAIDGAFEEDFISTDILSEDDLESAEITDTFTLSDYYNDFSLKDTDVDTSNISGFDKDAWYLLLVNKANPIPEGYEVPLTTIKGSMKCDERVLEPLINMLDGAKKDGVELVVCSPYREDKLQEKLFLRKINAYMSKGYSYLEAYKISSQDVIVPGTSEHQLGLSFDIVVPDRQVLDEEFANTDGGKWLSEHCAEYGFILRYPKGKEHVTGIEYEPWHFRYVGVEAATYITENGLTLEEFLEDL